MITEQSVKEMTTDDLLELKGNLEERLDESEEFTEPDGFNPIYDDINEDFVIVMKELEERLE